MKWRSFSILVSIFLLISIQVHAQDIRVEASVAAQKFETASVYPTFGIGYHVLRHHSFWLTFVPIFGLDRELQVLDAPNITRHFQAYSFGVQYRYLPIVNKTVTPYLKVSALFIPMISKKEQWGLSKRTDRSINFGIDVGIGVQAQIMNKLGIFGAINYRRVNRGAKRSFSAFNLDGFWVQIGVMTYF